MEITTINPHGKSQKMTAHNKPESEPTKSFTIRVPASVYRRIKEAAWGKTPDDKVPLNTFVIEALKKQLKERRI